jgi:DHA2 family multidrug resistance protein-like MFS transporter
MAILDGIPEDGLHGAQRRLAVTAIALALIMAVLDGAIANVALPTIAAHLRTTPEASISVINAYQLAVTVMLLPLSSLGEIYGYKRVYQTGLVVFTIASLACALSHTLLALTLARILQGAGAAGIMSVNGALTRFIYPRARLGAGLSMNALVVAASTAAGPTIAAAILSVARWEWLFAINVPVGVVAFFIARRYLPLSRRASMRFDTPSAILNAASLGLFILAVDGLAHGQSATTIALEVLIAAVASVFLVRRQVSRSEPLLPVDLLRIRIFRLSIVTSICSFCAQMLAFVSLPFYVQDVLGHSAVTTGLLMTPWPLMLMIAAPISGRLSDRYSAGTLGGIGLGIYAAGLLLTALLPHDPSNANIAWRLAICGIGFGLFQSPNNRAMISAAPRHRSGGASGMLSVARLLGQTLGATLSAVIFVLVPHHQMNTALLVACGFALGAMALSLMRNSRVETVPLR